MEELKCIAENKNINTMQLTDKQIQLIKSELGEERFNKIMTPKPIFDASKIYILKHNGNTYKMFYESEGNFAFISITSTEKDVLLRGTAELLIDYAIENSTSNGITALACTFHIFDSYKEFIQFESKDIEDQKDYVVSVVGQNNNGTFRLHETYTIAYNEAKRLSKKEGRYAMVLKRVAVVDNF